MNAGSRYNAMLLSLSEEVPHFHYDLFLKLPYLDLDERKALIKLSRSGIPYLPYTSDQIYDQTRSFMESKHFTDNQRKKLCQIYIKDPFLRSFLIDMVRAAPYTDLNKIHEEYVKSIDSEMKCHLKEPQPSAFNYNAIFGDIYQRIHPLFPYQPVVHAMIKNKIRAWVNWCKSAGVLYPKMSSKEPSVHSFRDCFHEELLSDRVQLGGTAVYSIDQAADYLGYPLEGENEMRTKWKYQDNKPRPYYAIGSTDFFRCGIARKICNKLADMFPNTHRHEKLDVSRLIVNPGDDALIYDLTAFTSNLSELKFFLDDLIRFIEDECGDPYIECAVAGDIHYVRLSIIMHCVNLSNKDVHFSIAKKVYNTAESYFVQGFSSGLLGVYTNIILSTVLHGILASIISGGFSRNRCAGDDGVIILPTDEIEAAIPMIQSIGDIAYWKFFNTINRADPYKVFLKRPFALVGETIFSKEMVPLPSVEALILPTQYSTHKVKKTPFSRLRRTQAQVYAFMDYLYRQPSRWSLCPEYTKTLIKGLLRMLYSSSYHYGFPEMFTLPHSGGICKTVRIYPIDDLMNDLEISDNRFERWLYNSRDQTLVIQDRYKIDGIDGGHLYGQSFKANSSPCLSYLEKLNYLSRTKVVTTYFVSNSFDEILNSSRIDKSLRVYEYVVLNTIPSVFLDEMMFSNIPDVPDVIEDTNMYDI